jgi:lipoprotein signal peptidase
MSRVALAAAAAVVAATLVQDALAAGRLSHPRPVIVLLGAAAIGIALLALAPRARSWPLSLGAGVAAGGAVATAIAGLAWRAGVPDPLVHGGVAFNLADVAIAGGDALMVAAALSRMWRQQASLRAPV